MKMYLHKDRCKKCKYGFLPDYGMAWFFEGKPMCLYFHDTGMHRDGDDNTCNSFVELTEEELKLRKQEQRRRYELGKEMLFY